MDPNIPPGLEYLAELDQILVKQVKEIFEILSGCEMNNKYEIKNSMGQKFLTAREDTNCLTRQCCGPARCFEMGLYDIQDQEVLHFSRPLMCASCCCPCCLQSIEIQAPPGTPIGTVHQEWSICTPLNSIFTIRNTAGDVVLQVKTPWCPCSCGGDVNFKVLSYDGSQEVGKITKQWRGFCAEAFTDADSFGITFPKDMDVRTKALMLGALFLIDFNFFETSNDGLLGALA